MKLIAAILIAVALTGCQTTVIKKEIVTVDKPIAFIPKPPEMPKFVSEVDKLTPADAADPGKVGVAYKYDMLQLRKLLAAYELIVEQYRASAQNFDRINAQIDALFKSINAAEDAKVKALTDPKK